MTLLKDLRTPVFHAEGLPKIDPATWRLRVSGLVSEQQVFTLGDIKAMPSATVDARLTSVSGFSVRAPWDGVAFAELLDRVKPLPSATHATFTSVGGYDSTLSFENLLKPRVILCYGVGGQPIELEYGGPLRLLVPHLWGYKSVKWLAMIEMTDHMKGGYWEDRGYSREAEIEPGYTFDVNTRKRRPIRGGGEVTEF